jgi:uncharacterized protein
MDYQFYRDLGSNPVAQCEVSAFGDWLTHDLADNRIKIEELIESVNLLQADLRQNIEITGKDYRLQLNQDEVEIAALFVGFADEDELPEGTEFEDPLIEGCGLEDFEHLLLAWRDFISSQ